jgi:MOSC domain-containing protein YiiM
VNHGGKDKAIHCYPREHYTFWSSEFGEKAPAQGTLGENFELSGVKEDEACIGDIFQLGEVVVQISQPRQPCWKPAQFHGLPQLTARVLKSGRTGWYLRVLRRGTLAAPEPVRLVERPCPEWTVTRATQVMHFEKDRLLRRELATVEPLSSAWKIDLQRGLSQ